MPAPITGQVVLSSGIAKQLTQPVSSVTAFSVKAPVTNTATAFIGDQTVSSSSGYPVDPGETFSYERSDQSASAKFQLSASDFWAIGADGDILGWLISP